MPTLRPKRRASRVLRCRIVILVTTGVEGKGGGKVVLVLAVWKKVFMVGAVRMCKIGRRG